MRTHIFTEREREVLETFLVGASFDKDELDRILRRIREFELLFQDIYLYLRIRKEMPS